MVSRVCLCVWVRVCQGDRKARGYVHVAEAASVQPENMKGRKSESERGRWRRKERAVVGVGYWNKVTKNAEWSELGATAHWVKGSHWILNLNECPSVSELTGKINKMPAVYSWAFWAEKGMLRAGAEELNPKKKMKKNAIKYRDPESARGRKKNMHTHGEPKSWWLKKNTFALGFRTERSAKESYNFSKLPNVTRDGGKKFAN